MAALVESVISRIQVLLYSDQIRNESVLHYASCFMHRKRPAYVIKQVHLQIKTVAASGSVYNRPKLKFLITVHICHVSSVDCARLR